MKFLCKHGKLRSQLLLSKINLISMNGLSQLLKFLEFAQSCDQTISFDRIRRWKINVGHDPASYVMSASLNVNLYSFDNLNSAQDSCP